MVATTSDFAQIPVTNEYLLGQDRRSRWTALIGEVASDS